MNNEFGAREGTNMLFCTECGFLGETPVGRVTNQFKYCPRCGRDSLINSCPHCHSSICYDGQKYCMSCGGRLQRQSPGPVAVRKDARGLSSS